MVVVWKNFLIVSCNVPIYTSVTDFRSARRSNTNNGVDLNKNKYYMSSELNATNTRECAYLLYDLCMCLSVYRYNDAIRCFSYFWDFCLYTGTHIILISATIFAIVWCATNTITVIFWFYIWICYIGQAYVHLLVFADFKNIIFYNIIILWLCVPNHKFLVYNKCVILLFLFLHAFSALLYNLLFWKQI